MVADIQSLKADAQRAAQTRGHKLGKWEQDPNWQNVRYAECRVCGASVRVDASPPANGIDISGTAVALSCPVSWGW